MDPEKLKQITAQKLAKRRKKDGSRPSSRHSSRRSNRSNHSSRSRTSQNTHLQVLSAVNGSATVSSTSLQSVGNGVGRMSSIGGVVDESRFSGSLHADSLSTERPVDSAKTNELSHTKPRSPVEPEITSIVVVGFNPSASIGSVDSAGRAIHPGGDGGLLGAPQVVTAVRTVLVHAVSVMSQFSHIELHVTTLLHRTRCHIFAAYSLMIQLFHIELDATTLLHRT